MSCGSPCDQARRALGAVARVARAVLAGDIVLTPDSERIERQRVCQGDETTPRCEFYKPPDSTGPRCLDCGCWMNWRGPIPGKWFLATEFCRLGKWKAVDAKARE